MVCGRPYGARRRADISIDKTQLQFRRVHDKMIILWLYRSLDYESY